MQFDGPVLEALYQDSRRLAHFADYATGMIGYETSRPKNHAGVPYVARTALGRPLEGTDILILGPGSTFETDEFWREGAQRIVAIDIDARPYQYEVREGFYRDNYRYPFPTTPDKTSREARWNAYLERVGFLGLTVPDALRVLRSGNSAETTEEEYLHEYDACRHGRKALLPRPVYMPNDGFWQSDDGRVRYIEGYIEEQLPSVAGAFDVVTAVALLEQGRYGPPEQMTEYKMWVSRRAEGRMLDAQVLPRVMQGVSDHLMDSGVVVIKTIHNPTFLGPQHFEPHGLIAENYDTETPEGWFTLLRKAGAGR